MEEEKGKTITFLYILSIILTLSVSFIQKWKFYSYAAFLKYTGFAILLTGFLIAIWALLHLKGGVAGFVEPKTDFLVRDGPYRYIRHPVYLGTFLMLLGSVFVLKSIPGLVLLFIVYLPLLITRARMEEKELLKKFGKEWEEHRRKTGFLFPSIIKIISR